MKYFLKSGVKRNLHSSSKEVGELLNNFPGKLILFVGLGCFLVAITLFFLSTGLRYPNLFNVETGVFSTSDKLIIVMFTNSDDIAMLDNDEFTIINEKSQKKS